MKHYVGQLMYAMNLFLPLVAGIMSANRLHRDSKIGIEELIKSTPVRVGEYVFGKYLGVLGSVVTPVFLFLLLLVGMMIVEGMPLHFLPYAVSAFMTISLPAFAFVTAFSIACPAVIPLRVYQVLFTGYWFWGNYLNPDVFPTLNGSYLTASGIFAFQGIYENSIARTGTAYSMGDVLINYGVILLALSAILMTATRFLQGRWRRS